MEKAQQQEVSPFFLPNFFRCDKCKTPFRLNKHGREYIPRLNHLICPGCGFDEVGSMIVESRTLHPPLSYRSRGGRKIGFYGDILDVNGFKCPTCGISFFVDADGKEFKQQ